VCLVIIIKKEQKVGAKKHQEKQLQRIKLTKKKKKHRTLERYERKTKIKL
jgi:hypothetical protein